jgi:uncharacterized protein (DUF697 family)/GTP-binding protein EngB required for normal cell division
MAGPEDIAGVFKKAVDEAMRERGHLNVLIAGRTGVGKSTLINTLFNGNMAATGQGRPVTKDIREINKDGIPISLFDTRGLEMAAYRQTVDDLKKLILDRASERDSNRHIHVGWICVHEDGRRVEDAEILLQDLVADHVPLLAVITKSRSDQGFRAEVQRLLPKTRNVIRVRALAEKMDDGHELNLMGLEELIEATSEIIPDGKRRAFAAAQKVSIDYKKKQAHRVVMGAVSAAVAVAASPIPFSDAAALVPIQVGMMAGISAAFGLELSTGFLTTLVGSVVGAGGATLIGRTIVAGLLKCIPGVGTVAGGAISAATAGLLTTALGECYITVLARFFTEHPDRQPDPSELAAALKKEMSLRKAA